MENDRKKESPQRIFTLLAAGAALIFAVNAFSRSPWMSVLYARTAQRGGGELAHCLAEKKAVVFMQRSCPACKLQEGMFGKNFEVIRAVYCEDEPEACAAVPVLATPTWRVNGETRAGALSLAVLSELSGCPL